MPCPICGEIRQEYLFVIDKLPVMRCTGCGLVMQTSSQTRQDLVQFPFTKKEKGDINTFSKASTTETDAAEYYIHLLKEKGLRPDFKVLLVSEPNHVFQAKARSEGWDINHCTLDDLIKTKVPKNSFDAVVLIYQLEKSENPTAILAKVHSALKTEGILLATVPSLDSNSAQIFGSSWTEWRPENKFYFDNSTFQLLLWRSAFNKLELRKDHRKYTLSHIYERGLTYPRSWVIKSILMLFHLFPPFLRNIHLILPSSGIIAIGLRAEIKERQVCSFVVPAYNESKTFPILMDALLAKQLLFEARKEIIIVESNSGDGTREQVLSYQNHPDVKVILQEVARGKGNAVRAGFEKASGDILLIQDADLEYDLNDLDILLEPLLRYQTPFVLGSRHGGRWKMRQFTDARGLSTFFNFGHVLFTTLLNMIYNQKLKDPFTMHKLFRRDCLHGLLLQANRFDFDYELVIKLIRKGYQPKEIPINYQSRSYKEGKKVRIFRDPPTWLWALIKYRFVNIYKEGYHE